MGESYVSTRFRLFFEKKRNLAKITYSNYKIDQITLILQNSKKSTHEQTTQVNNTQDAYFIVKFFLQRLYVVDFPSKRQQLTL